MRFSGQQEGGSAKASPPALRREPAVPGRARIRSPVPPQPGVVPGRFLPLPTDLAFLARRGIPRSILDQACRAAAVHRTGPLQELFAQGFDRERYWATLAYDLGLDHVADLRGADLVMHPGLVSTDAVRLASSAMIRIGRGTVVVLAPGAREIPLLTARLKETPELADRIRIAAPETIRALLAARRSAALTHYAVNRLARTMPRLSARSLGGGAALRGPTTLLAAVLALGLLAPAASLQALLLVGTAFFFNCSYWKLAAAFTRARPLRLEALPTELLPSYTVLAPMYREAGMVPDLLGRLAALDYPAAKLQILLLLERDDGATRRAVRRHAAAARFEVITVAPGGPRTKPKALTFALPFARGDLVVVFDAEDRPEPDQLRKAAAAFRERPDLGCVQARLRPDNQGSWYAKMFALEYAANFEVLLPALARLKAPLPLGGTSNHFPRQVLEKVGAWDPFNVTEDADLGIRLARFGYGSETIFSRTYEEAPTTFRQWLPQRRRWIKGWMQTSLICFARGPAGLRLSRRQSLAVHGIVTAGVLGLLLYPLSLVVIASAFLALLRGDGPPTLVSAVLLGVNFVNLAAVLTAAAVSAWRGLSAARSLHLAWRIPLLPLYWALMSVAAWQALFRLCRAPSDWEKTRHGVALDRRTPPAGVI